MAHSSWLFAVTAMSGVWVALIGRVLLLPARNLTCKVYCVSIFLSLHLAPSYPQRLKISWGSCSLNSGICQSSLELDSQNSCVCRET